MTGLLRPVDPSFELSSRGDGDAVGSAPRSPTEASLVGIGCLRVRSGCNAVGECSALPNLHDPVMVEMMGKAGFKYLGRK